MSEAKRDLVAEKIQAAIDACKIVPGRNTSTQEAIDNKITGGLLQEVLDNHRERRAKRTEVETNSRLRTPPHPHPSSHNPSPQS